MANLIRDHKPVIILGAGAFFIDRYNDNGGVRGAEVYVGDTVAAAISATVERTTVYSGDGAVATKLVDKITQVDRTLSITPQDATLNNMALFLMAAKPAQVAAAILIMGFRFLRCRSAAVFLSAFPFDLPALPIKEVLSAMEGGR